MSKITVTGVFSYLDTTETAIDLLKTRGVDRYEIFSPTIIPRLFEHIDSTDSPVRWVTLTGALIGITCGFLMQWWMGLDWPIRVSMKPAFALPTSTVIMFELTVLIGSLFNLGALFAFCGLPQIGLPKGYDPRFTDDKFGVVIEAADEAAAEAAEALLREAGAEEVARA
ncbi:MAG: DUF3341 domain-containing protein [Candidatus Dadabacteria bacterium]|nr:MAG: DUF3341 domain-containing protein [Candidatus Dadabacteria bacterium]